MPISHDPLLITFDHMHDLQYCGKKPKFRNSDYCTKSCAALATTAGSNQATVQGKQPAKPNLPNVVRHHHVSQNNSGHNVKKAAQAKPPVTVTQGKKRLTVVIMLFPLLNINDQTMTLLIIRRAILHLMKSTRRRRT